jgi:putative IMPACT (imprinted ancient) family translation regulator
VTRYFGGTLLGTGGLVRAYGDAARALLDELPRTMRIETRDALLSMPYPFYERVRQLAHGAQAELLSEEFGTDVTLALRLPVDHLDAFAAHLRDLTAGQVELLLV